MWNVIDYVLNALRKVTSTVLNASTTRAEIFVWRHARLITTLMKILKNVNLVIVPAGKISKSKPSLHFIALLC